MCTKNISFPELLSCNSDGRAKDKQLGIVKRIESNNPLNSIFGNQSLVLVHQPRSRTTSEPSLWIPSVLKQRGQSTSSLVEQAMGWTSFSVHGYRSHAHLPSCILSLLPRLRVWTCPWPVHMRCLDLNKRSPRIVVVNWAWLTQIFYHPKPSPY